MKKVMLIAPILTCLTFCFLFTACHSEKAEDLVVEEQIIDHTDLAEKMYSADLLEGKGKVEDGKLLLDVNMMDALTEAEIASIFDAGGMFIKESFNISYEDAVRIWGRNAPIPAEGISFAPGEYTTDGSRACTLTITITYTDGTSVEITITPCPDRVVIIL